MHTLTAKASGLREKAKKAEQDVKRLSTRAADLEKVIGKLYEDHLGRIPAELYDNFLRKFEAEKTGGVGTES